MYIIKRNTNWTPTFLPVLTTSRAHGDTCVQSMQIQLSRSVLGIGIVCYICKAIISNVSRFELRQYIQDILKRLRYSHTRVLQYNPWSSRFETICLLPTTFHKRSTNPTSVCCTTNMNPAKLEQQDDVTAWLVLENVFIFSIHPTDNVQLF